MYCPRCYTEAKKGQEYCEKCGYLISGFSQDYENPYVFRDKDWNPYIGILHRIVIEEEPEEADQEENKTAENPSEELADSENSAEEKGDTGKAPEQKEDIWKEFEEREAAAKTSAGQSAAEDLTQEERDFLDDIMGLVTVHQPEETAKTEIKQNVSVQTEKPAEKQTVTNTKEEKPVKPKKKKGKRILTLLLLLAAAYAGAYYTGYLSQIPYVSELPLPDLPPLDLEKIPFLSDLLHKQAESAEEAAEDLDDMVFTLDDEVEIDPDTEYSIWVVDSKEAVNAEKRILDLEADASSVLQSTQTSFDPIYAFDDNTATNWQEGVQGPGIGESVTAKLPDMEAVQYISFRVGSWKNDGSTYYENNRPKKITVEMNGILTVLEFSDEPAETTIEISPACMTSFVNFTIDEVYAGTKYDDTVITDIVLYRE